MSGRSYDMPGDAFCELYRTVLMEEALANIKEAIQLYLETVDAAET